MDLCSYRNVWDRKVCYVVPTRKGMFSATANTGGGGDNEVQMWSHSADVTW
jgi:hypothetical protein